jgi:hypothetical protein
MMPAVCSVEEHRELKRRPDYRVLTTFVGFQDDGMGGTLELRNCHRCPSTLATVVPITEERAA